jgi:hypothetical protein
MRGGVGRGVAFPLHVEKISGHCTVKKVSDFPGDGNIATYFYGAGTVHINVRKDPDRPMFAFLHKSNSS